MNIDLSTISPTQIYHLMTQTVVPRPIAWVLTESENRSFNLAPFSFFTAVSSQPPLLMLSIGKKPTGEIKDTTRNTLETGKLVIHISSVGSQDALTRTSASLEYGDSEVDVNEIELKEFSGFILPRVASCPIAFGCSLYQVQDIGDTPQSLLFAEIEKIYINDSVISQVDERLKIDALKIDPLSRLGGSEFVSLDKIISVARPN
ncbi:flavin reductase family protein [Vibrio sp. F74]|uniref:flavin reductase family protein n=1 Tax=Vibrio sp. F74 TaxID=700020 RepID=UPI0035F53122